MKKKAGKLIIKPRLFLRDRLMEQLEKLEYGEVNKEVWDDEDFSFITFKVGKYIIEFDFNLKGDQMKEVSLSKEIWEPTNEKIIFDRDKAINN